MYTPEEINNFIKNGKDFDTNLVSDGYHTFGELYDHRIALFIALCSMNFALEYQYQKPIWRSKIHNDGTSWDGWFILGMGENKGEQISYHLPMSYWNNTDFADTYEKAPYEWDGHTPSDVVERLLNL